jgi:S1-C subfamily serine protease
VILSSRLLRRFAARFLFTSLFLAAGVSAAEMSGGVADLLGIRGTAVAHIVRVDPGSVAESLSLSQGDLILAFNGRPLKEFSDIVSFATEMRVAAMTQKAVLEILKHDPRADSYTDQQVVAVLRESRDESIPALIGRRASLSDRR